MYIDLRPHLTQPVIKIDYNYIKYNDPKFSGKLCFLWNDSIYFPKTPNLNEFIGEQLAKEIGLRTVIFDLFENIYNGEIMIASKSFINPNSKYSFYTNNLDINNPNDNNLRDKCINNNNYQHLLNNLLKMLSLDIYMGQRDRWFPNFQLEKYDTGYLDLAPLYDYTDSSWNEGISYVGELYNFIYKEDYDIFFNTYPNALEYLKIIKKIDLKNILKKIEQTKSIKLPQDIIDIYLKREEFSQKKLEKIIK